MLRPGSPGLAEFAPAVWHAEGHVVPLPGAGPNCFATCIAPRDVVVLAGVGVPQPPSGNHGGHP